jgi:hypothetical protein
MRPRRSVPRTGPAYAKPAPFNEAAVADNSGPLAILILDTQPSMRLFHNLTSDIVSTPSTLSKPRPRITSTSLRIYTTDIGPSIKRGFTAYNGARDSFCATRLPLQITAHECSFDYSGYQPFNKTSPWLLTLFRRLCDPSVRLRN